MTYVTYVKSIILDIRWRFFLENLEKRNERIEHVDYVIFSSAHTFAKHSLRLSLNKTITNILIPNSKLAQETFNGH